MSNEIKLIKNNGKMPMNMGGVMDMATRIIVLIVGH